MLGRGVRSLRIGAMLVVALTAGSCERVRDSRASATAATPRATSIAQWDPVSRRFVAPPAGMPPGLLAPRAAPAQALREEVGPRGGRMVRLGGRFHHHFVASVGEGAAVTSTCAPASSPSEGR